MQSDWQRTKIGWSRTYSNGDSATIEKLKDTSKIVWTYFNNKGFAIAMSVVDTKKQAKKVCDNRNIEFPGDYEERSEKKYARKVKKYV